jgi:hypothetical protein
VPVHQMFTHRIDTAECPYEISDLRTFVLPSTSVRPGFSGRFQTPQKSYLGSTEIRKIEISYGHPLDFILRIKVLWTGTSAG